MHVQHFGKMVVKNVNQHTAYLSTLTLLDKNGNDVEQQLSNDVSTSRAFVSPQNSTPMNPTPVQLP